MASGWTYQAAGNHQTHGMHDFPEQQHDVFGVRNRNSYIGHGGERVDQTRGTKHYHPNGAPARTGKYFTPNDAHHDRRRSEIAVAEAKSEWKGDDELQRLGRRRVSMADIVPEEDVQTPAHRAVERADSRGLCGCGKDASCCIL